MPTTSDMYVHNEEEQDSILRNRLVELGDNIQFMLKIPDYALLDSTISASPKILKTKKSPNVGYVLDAHIKFKLDIQPWTSFSKTELVEQARNEVHTIQLLLPQVSTERLSICMAAWLGTLCMIDDLIESMPPNEGKAAIEECSAVLFHDSKTDEMPDQSAVVGIMSAFREHCQQYLARSVAEAFFHEVGRVLTGLKDEMSLRQDAIARSLDNYMMIRTRTIGISPFFALMRDDDDRPLGETSERVASMQDLLNAIAGLQNDLLGLRKDLANEEPMNATMVILEERQGALELPKAIELLSLAHNQKISEMEQVWQTTRGRDGEKQLTSSVVDAQFRFTAQHFKWLRAAKRYRADSEALPTGVDR